MKSRHAPKLKYRKTTLPNSDTENAFIKTLPPKLVAAITANVCEEKKVCPVCGRGDYWGLPLVFVLHYADESISTVCFSCGTKAARKVSLKLPPTEEEIFRRIEAEDNLKIQIVRRKMEEKNGNI
jgi:hypothetical protein